MRERDPRTALDAVGLLRDEEIDLAGAALQFARIDAPGAAWHAAEAQLSDLARAAAAGLPALAAPGARVGALVRLLAGDWGFCGDREDYDNPANANLIAVLERRRGLPVTLGIVWLHAARAAGWRAHGVDFPAHFLIALEDAGGPIVLDPFEGGVRHDGESLTELLAMVEGPAATLRARHLRPAGNRAILLRLTNNLRSRRLAVGDLAGALAACRDMLRIAPSLATLWADAAVLHQRLDQPDAAAEAFRRALTLAPMAGDAPAWRAALAGLPGRSGSIH